MNLRSAADDVANKPISSVINCGGSIGVNAMNMEQIAHFFMPYFGKLSKADILKCSPSIRQFSSVNNVAIK